MVMGRSDRPCAWALLTAQSTAAAIARAPIDVRRPDISHSLIGRGSVSLPAVLALRWALPVGAVSWVPTWSRSRASLASGVGMTDRLRWTGAAAAFTESGRTSVATRGEAHAYRCLHAFLSRQVLQAHGGGRHRPEGHVPAGAGRAIDPRPRHAPARGRAVRRLRASA